MKRLSSIGRMNQVMLAVGFVLIGYMLVQSWAGRPLSLDNLVFMTVVGVAIGSIYAIAASGMVVTYTTSGIFNFAQGAIGMFMAFIYWWLRVDQGLPTLVAIFITVAVVAPLIGASIERVLMRRLVGAPLVAQLTVTLGLMFFLIGLAATIWDQNEPRAIDFFYGTSGFHVGNTVVTWHRFITIVVAIAIAVGLRLLLYRTRLGVAMRAVVDNRELAALNGARPGRISMFSWALGSSMAAISGVLLAPELGMRVEPLTLLIVNAFAAAIIGRLRSLPMTYFGGILTGLIVAFQQTFLQWSGRWSSASFAVPTIVLFMALLFIPQARLELGRQTGRILTPRVPSLRTALIRGVMVFVVMLVLSGMLDRPDMRRVTLMLLTGVVILSLAPLTGWAGQISLAQITFVGVGAYAMARYASSGSVWGLLIAAAFAVPAGVLMALPALRLQGLYLALASMAFAQMAEFVFFDQPEIFGNAGKRIGSVSIFGFTFSEPFTLFGLHFEKDRGYLLLVAAIFGVMGVFVAWLRRGTFGRRLVAMRDSPAAVATLGVNLLTTKLAVYALAAAMAGFAGALLGLHLGSVGTADFQMLSGVSFLLLGVVGGIAVWGGALFGGVFGGMLTFLQDQYPNIALFTALERLGPGTAAIGIGRNPNGVVVETAAALRGEVGGKKRRVPSPALDEPEPAAAEGVALEAAPTAPGV